MASPSALLLAIGKKEVEEPVRVALTGSEKGGGGLCWERKEGKSYVSNNIAQMF
jgi:hypothetical protein